MLANVNGVETMRANNGDFIVGVPVRLPGNLVQDRRLPVDFLERASHNLSCDTGGARTRVMSDDKCALHEHEVSETTRQ